MCTVRRTKKNGCRRIQSEARPDRGAGAAHARGIPQDADQGTPAHDHRARALHPRGSRAAGAVPPRGHGSRGRDAAAQGMSVIPASASELKAKLQQIEEQLQFAMKEYPERIALD